RNHRDPPANKDASPYRARISSSRVRVWWCSARSVLLLMRFWRLSGLQRSLLLGSLFGFRLHRSRRGYWNLRRRVGGDCEAAMPQINPEMSQLDLTTSEGPLQW